MTIFLASEALLLSFFKFVNYIEKVIGLTLPWLIATSHEMLVALGKEEDKKYHLNGSLKTMEDWFDIHNMDHYQLTNFAVLNHHRTFQKDDFRIHRFNMFVYVTFA